MQYVRLKKTSDGWSVSYPTQLGRYSEHYPYAYQALVKYLQMRLKPEKNK